MGYNTVMQTVDVELNTLVYGGDALGRLPDGRAVFVPFGLPGELVRARLVEEKRGHARAELVEILRPSPLRIQARCPHFGDCGGCHYQHLPYEEQLAVKQAIVRDQLQRLAGIPNPALNPIVPSPSPWNYRNTIQFSLAADGHLGFQRVASHVLVPVTECHLPEQDINDLWPALDIGPDSGIDRLEIRQGAQGDLLVLLEGEHSPDLNLELPISVVHHSPAGEFVLAGDDHLVMEVLDKPFQVSAGSFFQVNTQQAGAMVRHLQTILPLSPTGTLVDVYCGVGLFSAFLAGSVQRCIGVELSPSACQDFVENLDAFDHVELYEGAAEAVLPAMEIKPDAILVDPPRAGLAREALDAIVRMQPPVIAYVSCDPATLARDARRLLQAGYTLESVTPFDLFPQTYHIESISLFRA